MCVALTNVVAGGPALLKWLEGKELDLKKFEEEMKKTKLNVCMKRITFASR